jgi:NADH-quinone oxidoreductase subunit H
MTELGAISFGLFIIVAAVGGAAVLTWFERRLLGIWQDRYGPNRLGPFGAFQVVADMLKLLTKDDWVPPFADRFVFVFAPTAIVVAMLLGFAVVPFGPDLYVMDINIGLLFFLGMTSLAVYSVLLGGWPQTTNTRCWAACAPRPRWSATRSSWACRSWAWSC